MRSLRDRPSGWVTGKPSSKITMLRMPKPLRALEPRIEMPRSRGPLPCLTEMPGLSRRTSPTENDGPVVELAAVDRRRRLTGGSLVEAITRAALGSHVSAFGSVRRRSRSASTGLAARAAEAERSRDGRVRRRFGRGRPAAPRRSPRATHGIAALRRKLHSTTQAARPETATRLTPRQGMITYTWGHS